MKLSELLPVCGIKSTASADIVEVFGAADHTDDIKKGDLFIARKGAHTDPLTLIDDIIARGASALLVASGTQIPENLSIPVFFADDLADAECRVWQVLFGDPAKNLRLFAVTGTNGKTTTACILSHLFCASGIPCGYIGTLGANLGEAVIDTEESTMTTPHPRLLYHVLYEMKQRGARAVVLEVSSHALSLGRVCRLHFESAIFTNLGEDHLDFHKTKEGYYLAKRALFSQASLAIVNTDDDYGERLLLDCASAGTPVCRVGVIENADYTLTNLNENGIEGTEYLYCTPYSSFSVSYPLFGAFNAYNTLFAVTAALTAGLCPEQIRTALATLPKPKGRAEVLALDAPFTVILDYAHTPDAMESILKAVRRCSRGRLFVLFGAGGEREREKRPLMGEIAERLADFVVLTTDNPRAEAQAQIFADILAGMHAEEKHTVIPDRKDAIERTLDRLSAHDTLLLLGKGHEEYLLIDGRRLPFCEREIVLDHLKKKELP